MITTNWMGLSLLLGGLGPYLWGGQPVGDLSWLKLVPRAQAQPTVSSSQGVSNKQPQTTVAPPGHRALTIEASADGQLAAGRKAAKNKVVRAASPFTCPVNESRVYFCDDFEDGVFRDTWDDRISTYGLSNPGIWDVLDEGEAGRSLRFTAGARGSELHQGELLVVRASAFDSIPDNYYLEYKIRPRANSNTGNKYVFAMLRYQEPMAWYFGGLNLQNQTELTQIESGRAVFGGVEQKFIVKKPIEMGTVNDIDGRWYTVRIDVFGNKLTTYLDGIELGSWEDDASTYSGAGQIGFFTYNRSFELAYVKVGDPKYKPVQLILDDPRSRWVMAADHDPLVFHVTAIQSDRITNDTFSAVSSDESVVSVVQEGDILTLTPVAKGKAKVQVIAGSDPSVVRTIEIEIEAPWVMPKVDYGRIRHRVSPRPPRWWWPQSGENPDVRLSVIFDNEPTLGSSGDVRIYEANSGVLVDRIRVGQETEKVGYLGQSSLRELKTSLIFLEGKQLTIAPHSQALGYNTRYVVAIGEDVVLGAKLNDVDFRGLGKNAGWYFNTKKHGPSVMKTHVEVDASSAQADFATVQGALDWMMEHKTEDEKVTVNVRDGIYHELLYLSGKNNVDIVGQSRDGTIVQGINYDGLNGGTTARPLFLVEQVDMLTLDSLTIRNLHVRSGAGDQAETLYFNSDKRLVVINSAFYSEQDTLNLRGYAWFYKSLVVGNVDFIWGSSVAALFERVEIRTVGDSKSALSTSRGGYVLQARVQHASDPGYIFLHCKLTHGAGPKGVTVEPGTTYLARSSGRKSYFDNIAFIYTAMDSHIASIGWAEEGVEGQPAPHPAKATPDGGWREFGTMNIEGRPLDVAGRCGDGSSCSLLSEQEVEERYSDRSKIFAGFNDGEGWNPSPAKK